MVTMFQVDHREDPPPELLLQHVLNQGHRIAVMLRLGVWVAVVHHEPPLLGTTMQGETFWSDEASKKKCFSNALGYTLVVLEVL